MARGDLASFERFCSRLILDNRRAMVLEDFQRTMLADFFAGVRETTVCIAKGSGKTTLLAALALYELLTDPGCEGAVCAASRDQAALLLRQLRGFVERSPGLAKRVRILQREATNKATGGRFRVLASDSDTMDGLILSFAVADEIHRWPKAEQYTILFAGVQKLDGKIFGISTAGVKDEGLLWDMRNRAIELGAERDGGYLGLRTDGFAWHEWSLDETADPHDFDAVKDANPAPWITPKILHERFDSPARTEVDWRRFSCNQWVERNELESVFQIQTWLAIGRPDVRPIAPVCFAIDATLDRSSAAIGVAGFTDDTGELPLVDVCDYGSGIAWAVERAVQLSEAHENVGIVVDPGGPANSLIPRLREWGLTVHEMAARQVAAACGSFWDAVRYSDDASALVLHSGEEVLTQAVQGAAWRPLGQNARGFDRKLAVSDPCPLMAAVLARWGLLEHGPISEAAFAQRFGELEDDEAIPEPSEVSGVG